METDVREELQRFYIEYESFGKKPANIPKKPRPKKKGGLGWKIVNTACAALVVGELAYGALINFCDKLESETLRENMQVNDGAVWVTEQNRKYCLWPVYNVTAFDDNDKIVYDNATGFKPLADWHVKRAVKKLKNL